MSRVTQLWCRLNSLITTYFIDVYFSQITPITTDQTVQFLLWLLYLKVNFLGSANVAAARLETILKLTFSMNNINVVGSVFDSFIKKNLTNIVTVPCPTF